MASSSIFRVARNARRVGLKNSFEQLMGIDDIKYGTLKGVDRFGNKYFENTQEDEIHLRTRWVEFKEFYPDPTTVDSGWKNWLSYGIDPTPDELPRVQMPFKAPLTRSHTGTRGKFVTYNTAKPKVSAWAPKIKERA